MYSGYELIWLFFCTSFLGWLLETVSAATHSWQKAMDQKFDISECIERRIKFKNIFEIYKISDRNKFLMHFMKKRSIIIPK